MQPEPNPAPDGQSSLTELARETRQSWAAALAADGVLPAGLDAAALQARLAEAGQDLVARIGIAMLQEGLLQPQVCGDGEAKVPVPRPGDETSVLVLHGLSQDSPSLYPKLRLFRQSGNQHPTPIEDPIELLEFVVPAMQGAPLQGLSRVAEELTDSWLNDALCRAYRAAWNERLRETIRAARRPTLWDWLRDRPEPPDRALDLEQWSAVGHPYHPTHKTRLGMAPAEVLSFCPEFEPQVQLGLVAARRERCGGETMAGAAPGALWLERHFPAQAEAWREGLIERGQDPADYLAIPVHPWQARHVIPKRFARSIAAGDLVPLPGPAIPCAPTVSVRTLEPLAEAGAPHIKVSLGVRLTSVERTISPRSCEMGPRISALLENLIARDATLSEGMRILPEEAGLYFAAADPEEREEARHLAAVLRRNPALACGPDEIAIPATALAEASPMTGAPLVLELSPSTLGADPAAVRAALARYAEALLRPLLTLFLRYGIALEAHMQNTLGLCGRDGALRRFLFRDFGGIRIHEPSLRAAGLPLEVHPDRLTVVDARDEVRNKLTSRTLHYHLGYLISRVCRHLQTGEAPFWSDTAEVVRGILEDLRGDVAPSIWRRERAALLDDDWEHKTSLRMRIQGLSGDTYRRGPNPLRWTG
ncbi:IucA/IucC family siderophore biosynthesis protein [Pelagibius sp.]|uniref:IucA/IucC family protein n=1 Tax=Pelagibius sp. TaxID=1931238 RepID=UPI00262F2CB5|nr:IucA/IucC family protein [Pelagibius sp.]